VTTDRQGMFQPFALATQQQSVYNGVANRLGTKLPQISSNASRRWTVIAAGLLILAIALVVIYAGSAAFHSPMAAVVLAAIGLAAVLLQLRLRQDSPRQVRVPQWLNLVGIVCAVCALFADRLRLGANLYQVAALGAVGCFGVSSLIVLDGMRRSRPASK
jgi:ABC-type transport system involved in cytochrome c biogenesis permease subunit